MNVTKNYKIFKNIGGNRPIIPGHVDALVKAIKSRDLLAQFPIIVNEKMEVIDGQHRLVAAMTLNKEVSYLQVDGLDIDNVMGVNTASKGWSLANFVDSYIERGNQEYVVLKEFCERHGISISNSANLLFQRKTNDGSSIIGDVIRNGSFRASHVEFAEKIANEAVAIGKFADFNAKQDRKLLQTLGLLEGNEDFEFDRLMAKMRVHNLKLEKRMNIKYYLLELEELYNFNAKKVGGKVELYASSLV